MFGPRASTEGRGVSNRYKILRFKKWLTQVHGVPKRPTVQVGDRDDSCTDTDLTIL